MTTLEIAVTTAEDGINAQTGGAQSIELSYDLAVGGLTPAYTMIQAVRDAIQIPVYVILRPHAESFIYSDEQIERMLKDITVMKAIGIDGVVFGAVTAENKIDVALIKQIVAAAAPLPVTLHRALDESQEPEKALTALKGIVPRVLTSGPAATAWEGRDVLKLWVEQFGLAYAFVGAGSLTLEQLTDYIRWVQPATVHLSSGARTKGVVNVKKVRQLRAIVDQFGE